MSNEITVEQKLQYINSFKELEKNYKNYEKFFTAFQRLTKNKDFETVILKEYLEQEAIRAVYNKNMFKKNTTPQLIEWSKVQDELNENVILGINALREFLETIPVRYKQLKSDYDEAVATYNQYMQDTI